MVEDDVTLFQKSIVADHCHIGKSTVIKQKENYGLIRPLIVIR